MNYKLGLKDVLAQPHIKLRSYYTSSLPTIGSLQYPLGHSDLIQPKMLCNDVLGDCAVAGSIEEVRLANALRGVTVDFTDKSAVENYSQITGYEQGPEIEGFNPDGSAVINPEAPPNPTDEGTDVHQLYTYRQKTGIVDASGKRHKIVGYAGLTPGDWDEMLIALSIFQMVGIGIQVLDYCQQQFAAGQAWHLVPGDNNVEGGHYIPIVNAPNHTEAGLFTWGALGGITPDYYQANNTVACVALTEEDLTSNALESVDVKTLAEDLRALNTGNVADAA